jgi:tetratricopeptide (TPR) repeat protein
MPNPVAILTKTRWRPSSPPSQSVQASSPLHAALARGQLHLAIQICEQALLKNPGAKEELLVSHLAHVELGLAAQAWWALERRGPLQDAEHAGQVLGMKAFALQMDNLHVKAEESAARALALDARDPWALLALLEVYDKEGRNREGLRLLRELEHEWSESPFRTSFGLRRCSMLLDDRVVHATETWDFPWAHWAVADAAGLLWRMQLCGAAEPGAERARQLRVAVAGRGPAGTAFDAVHARILGLACGLATEEAPGEQASGRDDDVGAAMRFAGRPVIRALGALPGDGPRDLLSCRGTFAALGGTSAHRDALEFGLVAAAASAAAPDLALALCHERIARRSCSPQSWMLFSRVLERAGNLSASSAARLCVND